MEKIQTHDLTRFGKFAYVLGVRKRDFFIDSIINTIASIPMKRTLPLYIYPRNPKRIRFLIGLVSNSEQLFEFSPDPTVGRPTSRPTQVPVDRVGQPRPTESKAMSVGRPGDRPFSFCGRPGGRPRWPVHVGAHRSTAPVDRCLLLLFLLCLGFLVVDFLDFLSLPT